ncbi:Retrovirus-related Pol polyprotein from transposon RE1 [Senna tora]|uniref:Retrovirus-related Pol polyprotein from transposon RE1 n=1 Tax=Senna tora TaxID=362788 RepID=A0A834X4X1_9FABA|nr:Retrovirus-related Pol polyprotein from transposon RE1 [Senna tora]
MALVNTILDGGNYLAWTIGTLTALEAKDKTGYIDGSIPALTDPTEFKKWKKVHSMIKSWMVNSLSKELSDYFAFCLTSKAMWDVLQERFDLDASIKLMQFLMSLNSLYDVVRTQILNLDPTPSANKAYNMVIMNEKQKQLNMIYSDPIVVLSGSNEISLRLDC